jgi:hypothetical protein
VHCKVQLRLGDDRVLPLWMVRLPSHLPVSSLKPRQQGSHPHVLTPVVGPYVRGFVCDRCSVGSPAHTLSYHCSLCAYDECPRCHESTVVTSPPALPVGGRVRSVSNVVPPDDADSTNLPILACDLLKDCWKLALTGQTRDKTMNPVGGPAGGVPLMLGTCGSCHVLQFVPCAACGEPLTYLSKHKYLERRRATIVSTATTSAQSAAPTTTETVMTKVDTATTRPRLKITMQSLTQRITELGSEKHRPAHHRTRSAEMVTVTSPILSPQEGCSEEVVPPLDHTHPHHEVSLPDYQARGDFDMNTKESF